MMHKNEALTPNTLEKWQQSFYLSEITKKIHQGKDLTPDECSAVVMICGLNTEQANYLLFGNPVTVTKENAADLGKRNFNMLSSYYSFRKREERDPNEFELLIEYHHRRLEALRIAHCMG